MQEEKEIKIEILNKELSLESIKEKLENLYGILFKNKKIINDFYFDIDNKLFNLNHALRIRDVEEKSFITYKALFKIPERKENPWFILEKEFEFPIKKEDLLEIIDLICLENKFDLPKYISREEIEKIFSYLHLKKTIIIDKTRYSSDKEKGFQILIDFIKDLGLFIEIEAITENIRDVLKKFTEPHQRILYGYTNLYAKNVLNLEIPNFDEKYNEDPDWNYLPGQKKIIQSLLQAHQ